MTLLTILAVNLALALAVTFGLWLISLLLRDASIVDIFWGLGFAMLAWATLLLRGEPSPRAWLLVGLASVWGVRLAGYLAWRNFGKEEDYRYRQMRKTFGERFWIVSLFVVFWLQAVIMWVVALPLVAGQFGKAPLWWLDVVGIAIWATGLAFESIGDLQLARFKANPTNQGQVLDTGLWQYTRHPNYFGDFLIWWGLFTIAAAGGSWWTFISPALMSFLLMRVSGVTLLEKTIHERRPEYKDYIRRTSPFFPWPPTR